MRKISIILPTYNEAGNIRNTLTQLTQVLHEVDYEIIVVDDNSPDKTWELAENFRKTNDRVRVIHRMQNPGLSKSIQEGFEQAEGQYLCVRDADLQHDLRIIVPMLEKASQENFKIVVGSRQTAGGSVGDWPMYRRFVSFVATTIAEMFLDLNTTDPMSGFFILDRKFFDEHKNKVNTRGFKLLLEYLVFTERHEVGEVGYVFQKRHVGESKLGISSIIDLLISVFTLFMSRQHKAAQFAKFCFVGSSGVLVHYICLYTLLNFSGVQKNIALILSIALSMTSNFILNSVWTFKGHSEQKPMPLKFISFVSICSLGAIINYSITQVIHNDLQLSIYLASLVGITVATAWNFFLNASITWFQKKDEKNDLVETH